MTRAQRLVKRSSDLACAAAGLVALLPLLGLVAALIRLTSSGPALFRQRRIGRQGKPFVCVKFRTMYATGGTGGTVTAAGDTRVTPLGRVLRKLKLDELPQLWNVLVGEMSLVGPRPDVPGYADRLSGEARHILELRPGVTGPATLAFRNEEALLAEAPDPQKYNDEVIWPEKVRLNQEYLEKWGFWRDVGYILRTLFGR